MAKFPNILRHGDQVGYYLGEAPFLEREVKQVLGSEGAAVLFDDFHLVHGGENPEVGIE